MKITLDISEEMYHETLKNTGAKTFQDAGLIAVREYIRYYERKRAAGKV